MHTWTHQADDAPEQDGNIQLEQSTSAYYDFYVIIIFTVRLVHAAIVLLETEHYCTVTMIVRYEVILITHWGRFEKRESKFHYCNETSTNAGEHLNRISNRAKAGTDILMSRL